MNKKNISIAVGIVGLVGVIYISSLFVTRSKKDDLDTALPQKSAVATIDAEKAHVQEVNKVINTMSVARVANDSEFYDNKFSDAFKEAYLSFRKGVVLYGYGIVNDEQRNYLGKALIAFSKIASDTNSSNEERSSSIDVINAIYISTSWDDQFMIAHTYTVSPFKEMYEKNISMLGEKYPYLKNAKDVINANTSQSALEGTASQLTMSEMNDMSYKLFPHGYPALRAKMNHASAYQRVFYLDPKNEKLSNIQKFLLYTKEFSSKEKLLAFEKELNDLDKKDLLYSRMRASSYEISLMKATVLYEPLVGLSTAKADKLVYHKKEYVEYKKAVDLVGGMASGPARSNLYVMVTLFYNAFLVDYGYTKKLDMYLDAKTIARYQEDSQAVVKNLMQDDERLSTFKNYIKKGKEFSKKPATMTSSDEYYDGKPYYQLRVLAEQKEGADLKSFLIKNGGWEF